MMNPMMMGMGMHPMMNPMMGGMGMHPMMGGMGMGMPPPRMGATLVPLSPGSSPAPGPATTPGSATAMAHQLAAQAPPGTVTHVHVHHSTPSSQYSAHADDEQ